jgi:hypothetical protein
MKYLVFLQYDSFTIVQRTLEMAQEVNPLDAWMQFKEEICKYELLKSSRQLSILDDYSSMPEPWIIYDGTTTKSAFSSLQFSLLQGTTIQAIEDLFQAMSHGFRWCLFNWGATNGLSILGFISSNEEIVNCFLKAYTQAFSRKASYKLDNIIISKYCVLNNFKEHFRALLVDFTPDSVGVRIWKACNCDQKLPWIVSSRDNIEFSRSETRFIQELNFIVEGNENRQMRKRRLKVIEPQNVEIFNELCAYGYSFDDTIIVIPSESRLDCLQSILSKTELYDCDNHDLQLIDEITSQFDWFYGISRDRTDARYSLFFSNNASLLQIIDSMQIDDDYQLISCF